jgi:2-iminobutanoate/2-iminopropanoate deaminase
MLTKTIITTHQAPPAIGPYSVAIRAGAFLFTSGQLGILPQSGDLAEGGIEGETRQVLRNLSAVLEAAGSSLGNVVKTTVFLRDLSDFSRMNSIYAEYFADQPPARTTIQAAGLPRGAAIEMECIAIGKNENE